MFKLNHLVGFSGGAVGFQLSFVDSDFGTLSSSTSGTINVSFGTPDATRRIYVGLSMESNFNITSMTIGGISATRHVFVDNTNANPDLVCDIWSALVPTDTSGDVVLTGSGGAAGNSFAVDVYRVINGTTAAHDSATDVNVVETSLSFTLDIPVGGAVIAVAASSEDTVSAVWTNVTEDSDRDAGTLMATAASQLVQGGATDYVVSVEFGSLVPLSGVILSLN